MPIYINISCFVCWEGLWQLHLPWLLSRSWLLIPFSNKRTRAPRRKGWFYEWGRRSTWDTLECQKVRKRAKQNHKKGSVSKMGLIMQAPTERATNGQSWKNKQNENMIMNVFVKCNLINTSSWMNHCFLLRKSYQRDNLG